MSAYDQYGATHANHYPQQQQYPYSDTTDYNPYANQQEPYPSYDRGGYNGGGGYRDEPAPDAGAAGDYDEPLHRSMSVATAPVRQPSNATNIQKLTKERSGDYAERDLAFTPPTGRQTRGSVREWRKDYHGDLWTRGGTGACLCRFLFCTIFIAVFLIISIVLTLALYARPPNIVINNAGLITNGTSAIQLVNGGLDILLGVNISVANPNFFAIDLKKIQADIFYPLNGNKTALGGGSKSNVDFDSGSNKTFEFPFTVAYKESLDPNHLIIQDIGKKCLGNPKQDLTVDYTIGLTVNIIVVPVHVPISNSISFECPLTQSDIDSLLGSTGINITNLLGKGT